MTAAPGPPSIRLSAAGQSSLIRFGDVSGADPLEKPPSQVALVLDARLHPDFVAECGDWIDAWGVPYRQLTVDGGEELKSVRSWERFLDFFQEMGLDREGCVVAAGGGSVGDAAGFAAATWLRGVPWVGIPTTLLAMVDAFVGGKTGLNHGGIKNVLGAFHMPSLVQIDIGSLSGLPGEELRSGWGEVVKTAIVGDPGLFDSMESGSIAAGGLPTVEVIERCLRVKTAVVEQDFRDAGRRMVLNLGHTLGHALEAWGGVERVRHGDAVAVGTVFAARIAEDLELGTRELTERIASVLGRAGLPVAWDPGCADQYLSLMARDKKNRGLRFRMALPLGLGRVEIHRVPIESLIDRLHRGPEL
ncbi:MAG: 3-dehydroquinate synthase family protein [Planctomycetota bacterium]